VCSVYIRTHTTTECEAAVNAFEECSFCEIHESHEEECVAALFLHLIIRGIHALPLFLNRFSADESVPTTKGFAFRPITY
jgi:hypothetical protein